MKSFLIIGLGRFGNHLCQKMVHMGSEVMIIDKDENAVQELLHDATTVKIGDCTSEEVLKSLGVGNFDACFVCIGSNFQSSLEITSLLRELGAKYIISKASRDIQAKFLLRNGADEVVYPDKDIAERLAVKFSANHVFDYIELHSDYSIFEIQPKKAWIGHSISEMNIRAKYNVSVFGIQAGDNLNILPPPHYVMREDDHLMVVGLKKDINKLLENM